MWKLVLKFLKKQWKWVVIVLLVIALVVTIKVSSDNAEKYRREKWNVDSLTEQLDSSRTKNGEYVLTIGELQYTVQDFKRRAAEDAELIRELKLRVNEVKEIIKTVTETKIVYRDTLVMISPDVFKFTHDTKWWSVDETIDFGTKPPQVDFSMTTRDSISHILYRVPKCRFLGIHWGTKGYEIKVINHNPNSVVSYSRWISISKNPGKRKRD